MGVTRNRLPSIQTTKIRNTDLTKNSDRIITSVGAENVEQLLIVIQLDENGGFFRIFVPQVLAGVKDHPCKATILQIMLAISWDKMLQ